MAIFWNILIIDIILQRALSGPSYTPVLPPSYPLAVRNPYLSAWLPENEVQDLPFASARFWNGLNLTWSVTARVDGRPYSLFGVPSPGPGVQAGVLQRAEYTSTRTTFTVTAGAATFVLDFLSPISPLNYVRQSAPFSYLTVSASSIDTSGVQIYSNIDNTWAGQFDEDVQVGQYCNRRQHLNLHAYAWRHSNLFREQEYCSMGISVYCARPNNSTLTAAVGGRDAVRAQFAANGSLSGPREWQYPGVTAYAQDLGKVSKATTNVTFAIGYWRKSAINYLGDSRTAHFAATCSDPICGCVHVLDDFEELTLKLANLTQRLQAKLRAWRARTTAISSRCLCDKRLVPWTLRSRRTSLILMILLPSSRRLAVTATSTPGDAIYPMAPVLYVLAPGYLRLLLEAIMRYLVSGAWPHDYAVHDLGAAYPNATGHKNGRAEKMPVEECGSLLTLINMYQLATGDKIWAAQYPGLLQGYADYLVSNGLYPTKQLSSDDGLGDIKNQTGLAIKAAIALNAYGVTTGQRNYSDIGTRFAKTLYDDEAGTDRNRTHFTCSQGEDRSWGMLYNLYPDVLLNLSIFPAAAYAMQSSYYPTVRMPGGVPLDSLVGFGKTDWMMFAAATAVAPGVDNVGVRDMFIDDVYAYLSNGLNAVPFSDRFHLRDDKTIAKGAWSQYKARPVVGGHFAITALNGPSLFGNGNGGDGAGWAQVV
ncbi:hypothetical protein LTR35_014323 [Friedmanniomyces endolithicus]|uniref:Glutaminase n=1 Tax=Friedmanniomyces endolithicus TaxID=329885 RepID=A0AAN6G134_9PEZI|nr:hypothetical protein LTR35_014323 [Friedmanniomyces endolithicus]KAK0294322.1 hypothetical protein LTS00_006912 [Friedmanniomyces endolithicus]KAK0326821.1 hypothetical protein LTR82_002664 [Friedmanniomyces endolithicus]KAK1013335.1 hypothetical protein LTR54_004242 [Friedmanniomyces endolithicus]